MPSAQCTSAFPAWMGGWEDENGQKGLFEGISQTALKVMAFSTQSNHYYSSNSPLILVEFTINSPCIHGEFNRPVATGHQIQRDGSDTKRWYRYKESLRASHEFLSVSLKP